MIAFTDTKRSKINKGEQRGEAETTKVDLLNGPKRWYRLIKITGRFKDKHVEWKKSRRWRLYVQNVIVHGCHDNSWTQHQKNGKSMFPCQRFERANNPEIEIFAPISKGFSCAPQFNLFAPRNGHFTTNIQPPDVETRRDKFRSEWNVVGIKRSHWNGIEVKRHV